MGALLIGTERADTDVSRLTGLGIALADPIAVGIQVARLRQRLDYAATHQEWERLTRQIHDRISTTLFTLMMRLEAHAEQTRLEGSPVYRRFESMIPSFAQLRDAPVHVPTAPGAERREWTGQGRREHGR
ncbi:MAG: hypothetical protein F4187_01655 [Gemmatimonadetes bacterium]|nr:hypothetical protein [Gemmatimonadota bacterium]